MSPSNELSVVPNPLLLDDLLPGARASFPIRLLKAMLEKVLGLHYLAREYQRLEEGGTAGAFVRACFRALAIDYQVVSGDPERVPQHGPTLIVANHPFGAIEGMIMVELLLQRRPDVRIMANGFLKRLPELAELFLGVNPYGNKTAVRENSPSLREGLRWLRQGGLLVVFPAGDVASIDLKSLTIHDGAWSKSVARLARLGGASIVPFHFQGYNSPGFYLASLLHPLLKTLLLPRQLINKQGKSIRLRIGKLIPADRLAALESDQERINYLRLRTNLLALQDGGGRRSRAAGRGRQGTAGQAEVIAPVATETLAAEIDRLPSHQLLASAGALSVFQARAGQIPALLREIGRLREISFRAAGEGTGRSLDIDVHDDFYRHLFVWDTAARRVVGAYRLGLVDEIVGKYGRSGLYSHSLFRYRRRFMPGITPGIELGRSFVRQEYQRSFTPLMLLWKGIAAFVAGHPRYAVLFGPVSISNEYSSLSQQLLVGFLRHSRFDDTLARQVRPRSPWRGARLEKRAMGLQPALDSLGKLSELLVDIEPDEKGVPVLLRQYLKLGGQILGFNVDAGFSNVIDALIRVDLRNTDPAILARYMGKEQAGAFLAWHAAREECRNGPEPVAPA